MDSDTESGLLGFENISSLIPEKSIGVVNAIVICQSKMDYIVPLLSGIIQAEACLVSTCQFVYLRRIDLLTYIFLFFIFSNSLYLALLFPRHFQRLTQVMAVRFMLFFYVRSTQLSKAILTSISLDLGYHTRSM